MAARHFRVSPRFWSEAKREGWTDDEIILGLYILTCDHRNTEGLFRLPQQYISSDLGWASERLTDPFAKLIKRGFIHYDAVAEVVLITKALKWQYPATERQIKGAIRVIEELPSTPLLTLFIDLAERHTDAFGKAVRVAFGSQSKDLQHQALALAPSQAQAPSPSSGHSNGDGDEQPFEIFKTVETALEAEDVLDEVDRDLAIKVIWPRLRAREHFTSPVAYALKVAHNSREARAAARLTVDNEPREIELEGERYVMTRHGWTLAEEVSA